MDVFSLCLEGVALAGQAALHIGFAGRLTGKRPRPWHFAVYLALLAAVELACRALLPGAVLTPMGLGMLALCGVSRVGLRNRRGASWLAAVLAFCITQLSFGLVNSVEAAVFPYFLGKPALYPLVAAALVASLALCAGCCAAVGRLLRWTGESGTPYLGLLLFPGLFCFAAELYILRTAYGGIALVPTLAEAGRHGVLLLLQAMGLGALLCTLYAYRQLCQGIQVQAAARAQRAYLAGAQARSEQTRAFRHDIRNHLSVLDGLLRRGELEAGRAYLSKLEAVSVSLTGPYQTGSPVVDILLGEKLGLAPEITAEVALVLPQPCGIDEPDLCVIFANALDNAVAACRAGGDAPFLRVAGQRQGDFYLLTFENTCPEGPLPPPGTGLASLRAAAGKYRGAVQTEKAGGRFTLSVLLDIS